MFKNTSLTLIAIFALFATFSNGRNPPNDEAEPISDGNICEDIKGKIVEIQTTTKRTFVLENVKVVRLDGQLFLSGTGVKDYAELWWEEMPIRVRLSFVVSFSPMTPQEFEKSKWKRGSDTP